MKSPLKLGRSALTGRVYAARKIVTAGEGRRVIGAKEDVTDDFLRCFHQHLAELIAKGYLEVTPKGARAMNKEKHQLDSSPESAQRGGTP
jgi:hypothetical protein